MNTIPSWEKVFRCGFAPGICTDGLLAFRHALAADDARLIQGATTSPPPLMCVQDWPADAGCAIGFVGAIECGGFAPCRQSRSIAHRADDAAAVRWVRRS